MSRNYLKLALRNLRKNKTYVLINMVGMGVALACCIVAYINYSDYSDFDRIHDDVRNVYRINSTRTAEGEAQRWGVTPLALGPAAASDIPGIERNTRISFGGVSVRYEDKLLGLQMMYVDPAFFDMFSFRVKSGSLDAIEDPSSLILTERAAKRYFGEEVAVGKTVDVVFVNQGEQKTVTVGAVLEAIPWNSSIQFDGVMPISEVKRLEGWDDANWEYWQQPINFIQLTDRVSPDVIEAELQRYVPVQNAARPNWMVSAFDVQPFEDVAPTAREFEETGLNGPPPFEAVLTLVGLAGLILLIACFNFTNTTIALSGNRLREIGLRKSVGAQRSELVRQFLSETLVLCVPALLAGLLFARLLAQGLSDQGMSTPPDPRLLLDWRMWGFLTGLVFLTGLIAGTYPALYITSFRPVQIFAGRSKFRGSNRFTRFLLGAQLAASILAIVVGVVFTQNARYQQQLPLGFNTDEIIAMPVFNPQVMEVYAPMIRDHPKIKSVAGAGSQVGSFAYQAIFSEVGQTDRDHNVFIVDVGPNYFETMDLEMVAGRYFDDARASDYEGAIINQTLLEDLGWDAASAIGRAVVSDGRPYAVIGVVKDFKQFGMRQAVPPISMHMVPTERIYTMSIRAAPGDLEEVGKYLESEWYKVFPNMPFYSIHMDQLVRGQDVETNNRMAMLFLFLAVVATVLSAFGLFALVSLRIVARTKEIGIRKVFGAPFVNLVNVINREFYTVLGVAAVLGAGVGYYLSNSMLDEMFAFRASLNGTAFAVGVVALGLAALLTVGFQVYRAATANPVESLRTE
ncbi:MAG TPA: FtsX-like permease family protein [Rhodothermia bacterium]